MWRGLTRLVAVARERARAATRAKRSVDGSTREGPTLTEGRTRKTFGKSVSGPKLLSALGTKGPMGGFFWHRETKERFNVTVFGDVQNALDRSSERSRATPPVRQGKA